MGEVCYSSMKFKKNLRQGTAATQDEGVTYSEVKIINPTTSNTVCHCDSAGRSGQSSHPYRRAAVCLGLLCALLLAATLVLCVLYTSQSGNYSMVESDQDKLRSNCSTTNKEKVHQQKNCSMLETELKELRSTCSTMNEEKVQQQSKYSMLERELDKLNTSYNTMNEEKVQQQNKYSMLERELDKLNTSCNTMNEEKVQQQGRVCEPCPQAWELFSSKCYSFSNQKKTWTDSRSDCNKWGADLVIIESEEEQRFITSKTQYHTWIGLSYSAIKGNWFWVDETPLQKGFWGSGKPDVNSGYGCAFIATKNNAWDAYYCYNQEQWICEMNALLP